MRKYFKMVAVLPSMFHSLIVLIRQGRLLDYFREFAGSATMARINLFCFLGSRFCKRKIGRIARRAIWNRAFNDLDFEALSWRPFEAPNWEVIERTLEQGKGVLVVTQHVGPYRRIFFEFIRRGGVINVVLADAVAQIIHRLVKDQLTRQGMHTEAASIEEKFKIINAEQAGSARKILRALRANEPVLVYTDGNTGVHGQLKANQHAVKVKFFDQWVTVRKGVCHLAYMAEAPMIPVLAKHTFSEGYSMEIGEPIRPNKTEMDRETFSKWGMQELFSLTESWIMDCPEQFEEWYRIHRWRDMTPSSELASSVIENTLTAGHHLQVDPARVWIINLHRKRLMVVRERCSIVKVGSLTESLLAELYKGTTFKRLTTQFKVSSVKSELIRLHGLQLLETASA